MSASVLFDQPGPRARRNQLIAGIIGSLVILAILGYLVYRMYETKQFTARKWSIFTDPTALNSLANALINTLIAAILAIILSLIFGAVFGAMRVSHNAILRTISTVVVEFFRAVPLVLLILFVFLGFADTLQSISNNLGITTVMDNAGLGKGQGALASLVIGLTLYNGSVLAEIFRAGVQSVPRGQREAAYSIGLTRSQTLRKILAPQAIRTMLPAIISQSVVALKDTSLGLIVGYGELVRQGQLIATGYDNFIPVTIVLACVYIAINYSLSRLAGYLSKRQARTKRLAPVKADPLLPPDTMIEIETERQLKD
ncbi:amino acid ABC transporter permease [Cumulibacter manganitolerans]|uniref:amino acid ABC transporter permease n=1 Tax=Cumulibacter manganitolerans TaxID=1884992 RepID=UPI0012954D0C|nr:amino acid ABC transporter permease [Cumulibacter manganitolerans]